MWMIFGSFMPYEKIITADFSFSNFTFHNYLDIFKSKQFVYHLYNSCVITLSGTFFSVFFGSFSALYSVRNKRFSNYFSFWIVSTRIVPPAVFVLPLYILFKSMGMLNEIVTLIIMGFVLNYALAFWLMRNVFRQIPREMEFAAQIDGASKLRSFYETTMRYAIPGLILVSFFCGIFIWNEYLLSMVLTYSYRSQPLTILIGNSLSMVKNDWGALFALGTIQIIPVIVFYIFYIKLRKRI